MVTASQGIMRIFINVEKIGFEEAFHDYSHADLACFNRSCQQYSSDPEALKTYIRAYLFEYIFQMGMQSHFYGWYMKDKP